MEKTTEQIITEIEEFLLEFGYLKKDIKIEDDNILFSNKGINYFIFVETPEDLQFGINSVDHCDYDQDFLQNYTDYLQDCFNGVEDIFHQIKDDKYIFLKNIWKDLERLDEKYEEDELINVICDKYKLLD